MFYDHQDDAQMVFESCYQLVISTAFLARLWNEIWNRDKVSFPKQRNFPKSSPIFSITISERFSLFDIHRHCYYNQFRCLYEAMNDHWNIFTNDLERRILKEYSTVSRKFTIFYSSEYILYYVNLSMKLTMISSKPTILVRLLMYGEYIYFLKLCSYDVPSEFNVYSDPVDTGVLRYCVAS